jgi:hypothetical protein
LTDRELTSLREELALVGARTAQLLDRLAAGNAPPWQQAAAALGNLKAARSQYARDRALADLERLILSGAEAAGSEAKIWKELRELIDLIGKQAATQHKWELDRRVLVHAVDAATVLRAVVDTACDVMRNATIDRKDMPAAFCRQVEAMCQRIRDCGGIASAGLPGDGGTVTE